MPLLASSQKTVLALRGVCFYDVNASSCKAGRLVLFALLTCVDKNVSRISCPLVDRTEHVVDADCGISSLFNRDSFWISRIGVKSECEAILGTDYSN